MEKYKKHGVEINTIQINGPCNYFYQISVEIGRTIQNWYDKIKGQKCYCDLENKQSWRYHTFWFQSIIERH